MSVPNGLATARILAYLEYRDRREDIFSLPDDSSPASHQEWGRLLPPIKVYEAGDWKSFSKEQKRTLIDDLAEVAASNEEIAKCFASSPHEYSREKFAQFKSDLAEYHLQLHDGWRFLHRHQPCLTVVSDPEVWQSS